MNGQLTNKQGTYADFGQLDSQGCMTAMVEGGPHGGHTVTIASEKHNCGACGYTISCSCGGFWQSSMNGCWQRSHQREEEGDKSLEALLFHSASEILEGIGS